MEDSRLEHVRAMIAQAIKTDDETYMQGLLLQARKTLTEVLVEF
jgi:hypothetical protein